MIDLRHAGVSGTDAFLAWRQRCDAERNEAVGKMRALGRATLAEIADALGLTEHVERNRLRSRLVSWTRQGYLHSGPSKRGTVWWAP